MSRVLVFLLGGSEAALCGTSKSDLLDQLLKGKSNDPYFLGGQIETTSLFFGGGVRLF